MFNNNNIVDYYITVIYFLKCLNCYYAHEFYICYHYLLKFLFYFLVNNKFRKIKFFYYNYYFIKYSTK